MDTELGANTILCASGMFLIYSIMVINTISMASRRNIARTHREGQFEDEDRDYENSSLDILAEAPSQGLVVYSEHV